MSLIVFLGSALLCLDTQCFPVLVGKDTPTGTFALHRRYVETPGYGGDVLQFLETDTEVFAIHRVWLGRPGERRAEILAHGSARARRTVTMGCINVSPQVYERLVREGVVEIRAGVRG